MSPPPEHVHWLFATGFLFLGLCLVAESVVGRDVWRRRRWRAYLWPGLVLALGILIMPLSLFYTASTLNMLAHWSWAQVAMLMGAAQLGLVHGRLRNRLWELTVPVALVVTGAGLLVHEQRDWLYSRAAFLHHLTGWVLILGALFPLAGVMRPSWRVPAFGYAATMVLLAVLLFADRDVAPIFGHLSPLAGTPHR